MRRSSGRKARTLARKRKCGRRVLTFAEIGKLLNPRFNHVSFDVAEGPKGLVAITSSRFPDAASRPFAPAVKNPAKRSEKRAERF